MLNFIKKFFAKEEIQEEKIELSKLDAWLEEKTKPIFENLSNNINQIIHEINDEKEKALENMKILEDAKLQNPKIPERIKTIMEGNRSAFIKKISFFLGNIDLKFHDCDEILKKCDEIKNQIDNLGKSTARSYQVLNEFFAREAERIAANIKNIENYSNGIELAVKNSKISIINKIKNDIANIQNKIKLKKEYSNEMENSKNNLQNNKNKLLEIENKINEIKSSHDYKNYENLLEEKSTIHLEINNIENRLFHDFSVLERALKKYSKTAFENENLILQYLSSPVKALIADNDLKIIKILSDLEKNIIDNKLELETKKSEKTISKIKEIGNNYFINIKNNFKNLNEKLDKIISLIENNKSNNELNSYNKELSHIKLSIENLNNDASNTSNELGKISIEKLKENLQEEINKMLNLNMVIQQPKMKELWGNKEDKGWENA